MGPHPTTSARLCAGSRKRMSHPINTTSQPPVHVLLCQEEDRVLPHLAAVDAVKPASPPTPCELIRKILLHVFGMQGAGNKHFAPSLSSPSTAPRLEREWGNSIITEGQRSNQVIAFIVTCSAFYCLHR